MQARILVAGLDSGCIPLRAPKPQFQNRSPKSRVPERHDLPEKFGSFEPGTGDLPAPSPFGQNLINFEAMALGEEHQFLTQPDPLVWY